MCRSCRVLEDIVRMGTTAVLRVTLIVVLNIDRSKGLERMKTGKSIKRLFQNLENTIIALGMVR